METLVKRDGYRIRLEDAGRLGDIAPLLFARLQPALSHPTALRTPSIGHLPSEIPGEGTNMRYKEDSSK